MTFEVTTNRGGDPKMPKRVGMFAISSSNRDDHLTQGPCAAASAVAPVTASLPGEMGPR